MEEIDMRRAVMGAWLTSVGMLYAFTLRTSIEWRDAPEFADVASTLGIAHPPGSPTYALLGKLASLLPLGSLAVRIHLLSAACAVGALALCVANTEAIHLRLGGNSLGGRLGGVLAGTLLGVGPTFWHYATHSEVYAAFVFVTALLLFAAIRWEQTSDARILYVGALLFGLSGGVHGTSIFFAPALAFLVLSRLRQPSAGITLGRAALFGLLGASVFMYLPIRAVTEPPFNWSHPDTWSRFWILISDRKDASYHFMPIDTSWWPYIKVFARNLTLELTPFAWVGILGGITLLLMRRWRLALFLTMFCLGNTLFFLRIWTVPDAYLPTFFIVALLIGIFLARLLEMDRLFCRIGASIASASVLVAIALQAYHGAAQAGVSSPDAARSAAEENLLPVPEESFIFATANWFQFRYLQDVEGMRPDLTIFLHGDLAKPGIFTPVTAKRFPKLRMPTNVVTDGKSYPFFRAVLRENLGYHPIFWEPIDTLNPNVFEYLRPWRYLWRFDEHGRRPTTDEEAKQYFTDLKAFLGRELGVPVSLGQKAPTRIEPSLVPDRSRCIYHAYLLKDSAEVLELQGRLRDALTLYLAAMRLTPDNPQLSNAAGEIYSKLGRWSDADHMFRWAISFGRYNATPLVNLSALQTAFGRLVEARRNLERARVLAPRAPEIYYQFFILEQKEGHLDRARLALDRAIALTHKPEQKQAWRSERARLIKSNRLSSRNQPST
jgi:hypothetical protein